MRFLAFTWLSWQIILSPAILSVLVLAVLGITTVQVDHLQASPPKHENETRPSLNSFLLDRNSEDDSNKERLGIRWAERKLKPSPKPLKNVSPSLVVVNRQPSTTRKPAKVTNTAPKTGTTGTKKPLNKIKKAVPAQQTPKKGSTPNGLIDVQAASAVPKMPLTKGSTVSQTVTFAALSMNEKYVTCLQNFGSGNRGKSMKNNVSVTPGTSRTSSTNDAHSTTLPETSGVGKGSSKRDWKGGASGPYKASVVADITEAACLELFPALRNNGCIDPLNLIEGGYTPSLLNRDTRKNSYKTSSQSTGGNGSVNLRGRRHHRNRRLDTLSQNEGKSSGKSTPINPVTTPVGTLCYRPDPNALISSFLVGYNISCANLNDYVSKKCIAPNTGYSLAGSSVISQNVPQTIGNDIKWTKLDASSNVEVKQITIQGWPVGSVVSYKIGAQNIQMVIQDEKFPWKICAETEAEIRNILNTLSIKVGPTAGFSIPLMVTVQSNSTYGNNMESYMHPVLVTPQLPVPTSTPSNQPSSMPSFFSSFFNYNGSSVVVEDTPYLLFGKNIQMGISLVKPTGVNPGNPIVTLSNIPVGTILSWISAAGGSNITKIIQATNETVTFDTFSELDKLSLQAPSQSDTDFNIIVTLTAPGSYKNKVSTFSHPIRVLAVADKPQVVVTPTLDVLETGKVPLDIQLIRSADNDGSESLLVRFTLNPSQGILQGVSNEAVTFNANTTTGQYTLTTANTGLGIVDPVFQQAILNAHFSNGLIKFVPTYGFGGQANITVKVVSVEYATGADLAPAIPTDLDTKNESDLAHIFINVKPDSAAPSARPSRAPSSRPSSKPSSKPSSRPSSKPSRVPSSSPSQAPSFFPYPFLLSGSSQLVEDVQKGIGNDFNWTRLSGRTEQAGEVRISGFPQFTRLEWRDTTGTLNVVESVNSPSFTLKFTGNNEADLKSSLATLLVRAPSQDDSNFNLTVTVVSANDQVNFAKSYVHPVIVGAVADMPFVNSTVDLLTDEDVQSSRLSIVAGRSVDNDDSETLSVRLTVPSEDGSPVGTLAVINGPLPSGYSFTENATSGVYVLTVPTGTPDQEVAAINSLFSSTGSGVGVAFTGRYQWSGIFNGTSGIKVEMISTEKATGAELAPNNSPPDGTAGDLDTRTEIATGYIGIKVLPIITESLSMLNTSTIVDENRGQTTGSAVVSIPIGTRMNLQMLNIDPTLSANISLTGFPLSIVPSNSFAWTNNSLVTVVKSDDGSNSTLNFSGRASAVLEVIRSLNISLTDDIDKDFTVTVAGLISDTNGLEVVTDPVGPLFHRVVVRATADVPTITVPSTTYLAALNITENTSNFSPYPINVTLNDLDGSETIEQVIVRFTTAGTGGNLPDVAFDTSGGGSAVQSGSTPGVWNITGTDNQIRAILQSLTMKPGKDNGEDIIVTVTATSVESNPSEPNSPVNEKFALQRASATRTFRVPVRPTIAENSLSVGVPNNVVNGTEASTVSLGNVSIASTPALADTDNSEKTYMDIRTDSYPGGTQFFINGVLYPSSSNVVTLAIDGKQYIRFPANQGVLSVLPPTDYSGTFTLKIRGTITDTASDGDTAVLSTDPATDLVVNVSPVADCVISANSTSFLLEDATLSTNVSQAINAALTIKDNAVSTVTVANNNVPEFLAQVELREPTTTATTPILKFSANTIIPSGATTGIVTDLGPNKSGILTYDLTSSNSLIITSSIIETARASGNLGMLTIAQLQQAEQDIRFVLSEISAVPANAQSDLDATIAINVKTIDVNPDLHQANESSPCTIFHNVLIKAMADPVVLTVQQMLMNSYKEDAAPPNGIPLQMTVASSIDNFDKSEYLEMKVSIPVDSNYGAAIGTLNSLSDPAGQITVVKVAGSGQYDVWKITIDNSLTAKDQETALNAYLASNLFFVPAANWAGKLTGTNGIKVELFSVEKATGNQVSVQQTSDTKYIDVDVLPVADRPIVLIKGNASGIEDTQMEVPIEVIVVDKDSETFKLIVRGTSVPPGSIIYGASNRTISPSSDGNYVLDESDTAAFKFQAPRDWSDYSGAINLIIFVNVTDQAVGGAVDSLTTNDYTIGVRVRGIADKPLNRTIGLFAVEDKAYPLGKAVQAQLNDTISFAGVLIDTDGSEKLKFRVTGITGDQLIVDPSFAGEVNYLGPTAGYELSPAALLNATLKPQTDFSGIGPSWYANLRVTATAQEWDGSTAYSDPWPVYIEVSPVVDSVANIQPKYSVTEAANEGPNDVGVYLGNLLSPTTDLDGSEYVVDYNVKLTKMIDDAQIRQRLKNLNPTLSDAAINVDLLLTYLVGDGDYVNNSNGTITVYVDGRSRGFGSLRFLGTLFLDSNVDFKLPFRARVRDRAVLSTGPMYVESEIAGEYTISIDGTADVPAVYANNVNGSTSIRLDLNGTITDTDDFAVGGLGRNQSETVSYFMKFLNGTGSFENASTLTLYSFVNANGDLVGFDAGGGTWYFGQKDLLQHLYLNTPPGSNGTLAFTFIAISAEDDTTASKEAEFIAQVQNGGTGPDPARPLAPVVTVGVNAANEDNSLTLNLNVTKDAAETTDVTLSLVIRNLNPSLRMSGAIYNVYTNEWVISATALNDGGLKILAPPDYAGTDFNLEVQAIAANNRFQTNRTAFQSIPLTWNPVTDGPIIQATAVSDYITAVGLPEDQSFSIKASFLAKDVDGSEVVGDWVIVEFGTGLSATWNFSFSGSFQSGPFTVDGIAIGANSINISRADMDKLKILPLENWHGEVPITLHAFTKELTDPTKIGWKHEPVTFKVTAVPDPPVVNLQTVVVPEYKRTSIAGLLSAQLYDTVTANGPEKLHVQFLNLPEGSQFFLPGQTTLYGGFVEPGIYSIPDATKLATLEYLGPQYVSGNFTVTLSSITMETSNGLVLITDTNFSMVITPVASPFLLIPKDITVDVTGVKALELNVGLEDKQGFKPGENPPEAIELFFNFSTVPVDSIFLRPKLGGQLDNSGNGNWTFRGTEAQANALELVNVNNTGTYLTGVVGRTIDAGQVSPLSTDQFDFQVTFTTPSPIGEKAVITAAIYNGTIGNDFYRLSPGATVQEVFGNQGSDILVSSLGPKILCGGIGADQFVWPDVASISGGLDTVVDFLPSQGDQLNFGGLININVLTDTPSDFVRMGSDSILQVNLPGTGWTNVATLQGVTSFDANDLYQSGSLLL